MDRSYPPADRADLVEDLFGHSVADPYRWLEDATGEATEAWSEAQDELFTEPSFGGHQKIFELIQAGTPMFIEEYESISAY